jgi:hypothetical protein
MHTAGTYAHSEKSLFRICFSPVLVGSWLACWYLNTFCWYSEKSLFRIIFLLLHRWGTTVMDVWTDISILCYCFENFSSFRDIIAGLFPTIADVCTFSITLLHFLWVRLNWIYGLSSAWTFWALVCFIGVLCHHGKLLFVLLALNISSCKWNTHLCAIFYSYMCL